MGISFSASRRRFVLAAAAQTLIGSSLLGVVSTSARAQVFGVPTASRATAETTYTGPRYVPGEVLVGISPAKTAGTPRSFSAGASIARQQIEAIAGAQTLSQNPALGLFRLRVKSGETVEQAVSRLKASGQVSYAEPNYIRHALSTPNDPGFTQTQNPPQWGPQKVSAPQAWDIYNPQAQTVIAIIDTGITLAHEDLVNKIYKDSNGNVIGYNFVSNNTNVADDHGHGTHCAGIAAAQINNGAGVAGIAGWNGAAGSTDTTSTKIMPLKVLDSSGSGSDVGVANAIVWAADHGGRVLSMSLGGADPSQTLNNAVAYAIGKNCVVVAAAGNSNSSAFSYPGACPGVLSVASSDMNDTLSGFSNFGSWVTVAAPGSGILSTYFGSPTTYAYLSGTSMATPLVAGELALLASQNQSLTSNELFNIVKNNTDVVAPSGSKTIANGRVNVYKAMVAASLFAPTNVSAAANSRSMITLAWQDNSNVEDGYSVEMSTNSTTFTTLGSVGINKTGTTVSGLLRSTKYYFRLRPFAGATMGTYGAVVSATTKAF